MKRTLSLVVLALSARVLVAQTTPLPATRVTVLAGLNVATFTGDGNPDNRAGFVGGVGLVAPFAPDWSFQPELTYSMKGAKASEGGAEATIKLSYIEIPLLLRWDLPASTMAHPFFHAGPAVAFRVGCSAEINSGDVTLSSSCDNAGADVKTLDLGVMFGGGIAFKHMNHTASIGVRYNVGMNDIADGNDQKNRVLSFIATFEWPWSK